MKEAAQKFLVFKEEMAEILIDGENTMSMRDIDQLEGHVGGAFHRIFITAGRTKAAVTAERNKFKFATLRAAVHGTAIRRATTINHLLDIFNNRVARMKSIYYCFIIVSKDFLKNIHMTIMK